MLNALIRWSLGHRGLVLALSVLLLAYTGWRLRQLPLEVFPELNAPTITIMTEAAGFAAEEVERTVTFQLETALNGTPGLRRIRSTSTGGLSIVWLEFDFGTELYRTRQLVAERLVTVQESLPAGIHAPEMAPVSSLAGEIMLLGLTSADGSASPLEVRRIAEFELRPRLLAVTGVAQVNVLGGELPEVQVLVRPDDLRRYELTLADVEEAVQASHAPVGSGYLANYDGRELPLRLDTRAHSAADVASTLVGKWRGAPLRLDQVADVVVGPAPSRGAGSVGAKPAAIVTVQRSPEANTLQLTEQIDAALDSFEASMPKSVELERSVFRQADFIEISLRNVLHALRDAAFFVTVILFLFLLNFRTTFITLTALPLSLAAAVLVLERMGATMNVMTLAGIAVAVGSLVDDAIVDVENVFRRLGQNSALPEAERRPTLQVVFDASVEVRQAILLATAVIMLAFVPLFFLGGVEGRFFQPLGLAYVVALGASLLVAMTVTPVLCSFLLGGSGHGKGDGLLVRGLKRVYSKTLAWTLKVRWLVLLVAAAFVIGGGLLARTFGNAFLPDFNEGSITFILASPAGTSLVESDRVGRQLEARVLEVEGVLSVARRTGRAEQDSHAEPVNVSDLEVRLDPKADPVQVRAALGAIADEVPGITTQLGGPIAHRLSHILSGTPAAIAIKVFGEDLATLRAIAKDIESALDQNPGVDDLVANRELLIDTLPIDIDREALAAHGLTPGDVASQVETAFRGRKLGVIYQGAAAQDITLRYADEARSNPDDVSNFILRSPTGAWVPLSSVARIYQEPSPALITRENVRRKAVISCNVAEGHNLGDLVQEIRSTVDPIVARYPGTFVEYGGQFEAQEEASRRILWASIGVLLLVTMILYSAYGSMRPALLILLNLPLALVGGAVALFLSADAAPLENLRALFDGEGYVAPVVSISALVGFIGLAGIACRNGLLLISHFHHLMEFEGVSKQDAVVQGATERLVPILMTALSSALALVPLVLAGDQIGSELQYPIAVVILGGLVSSTFLNIYIVPAAFDLFGKRPSAKSALQDSV